MKKLMFLVFVLGTISTGLFAESTGENLGLEDCIFANQDQRAESDAEVKAEEPKSDSAATQGNL